MGSSLPFNQAYVIHGRDEAKLHEEIDRELQAADCDFRLADDFSANLSHAKKSSMNMPRVGDDLEFGRGKNAFDVLGFMKPDRDNNFPSRTMCPLAGTELYACIYGLATFSTHGGLICEEDSRVLIPQVIPGTTCMRSARAREFLEWSLSLPWHVHRNGPRLRLPGRPSRDVKSGTLAQGKRAVNEHASGF